jgi:hypothetical protein
MIDINYKLNNKLAIFVYDTCTVRNNQISPIIVMLTTLTQYVRTRDNCVVGMYVYVILIQFNAISDFYNGIKYGIN